MQTKEYFIQLTKRELPTTVACMNSIPAGNDTYAPDAKARSARRIVSHLIGHPLDLIEAIEDGVINHRNETEFTDYATASKTFEADTNRLLEMIAKIDEKTWDEKMIDFNLYGQKLYAIPLRDHCYGLHVDTIHHRGQLSTYYRSMGVRNPVIYGVTAETVEEMMASKN